MGETPRSWIHKPSSDPTENFIATLRPFAHLLLFPSILLTVRARVASSLLADVCSERFEPRTDDAVYDDSPRPLILNGEVRGHAKRAIDLSFPRL